MTAFRRNPIYLALRHVRRNAGPLSRRWLAGGMLAPAILLVGAHGVGANDLTTWTGDQDDNWVEDGNWDEGVPDNDTRATINDSNAVVVLNNETGETGRLRLINGQLEV